MFSLVRALCVALRRRKMVYRRAFTVICAGRHKKDGPGLYFFSFLLTKIVADEPQLLNRRNCLRCRFISDVLVRLTQKERLALSGVRISHGIRHSFLICRGGVSSMFTSMYINVWIALPYAKHFCTVATVEVAAKSPTHQNDIVILA